MHWLRFSLLAITLCTAYCQDSEAQTETTSTSEDATELPKLTPEPTSTDLSTDSTEKAENRTEESNTGNVTSEVQVNLTSPLKRDVENLTFNDIKPFLLFPILPFLFPPRDEENLNSGKDELSGPKNETSKIEGNPGEGKPFIFFDFAFNIRRIPINNATDNLNDSKIINVKNLSIDSDESKANSMKNRRRRNTKVETPGFFEDTPFFPDSELEEFLPKPNLFFPDLPFHHKPPKKLSRRKRDQKTELKNDFKSFFDAFDETFMRAKRELEWTDPILNFLRGAGEPTLEEKKDTDDLFDQLPDIQEKPSVKWRIQRNIKNNDRKDGLAKTQDSPTIIVDKVVKIGEFHVHDDSHDKNKSKKKRGLIDSKRKFLGHDNHDEIVSNMNDDSIPKSILELIKQEGSKRKKRNHMKNQNLDEEKRTRDINNSTQMSASFLSVGSKPEKESDKKDIKNDVSDLNSTEKLSELKRMFGNLKTKMDKDISKVSQGLEESTARKESLINGKLLKEELNKNLTELLKQFLILNKNLENAKLVEKLELSDRDDARTFDWMEKEALQNSNVPGKNKAVRQKKDAYFDDDDAEKKELRVADLNFLFLNVTLPTVCVLIVMLIVCFIALQVKGKICTTLFKSRRVLVVNDEATAQLKNPGTKKVQPI